MILFGDSKDDELKGVNLLRIELGNLTLAIWKVPIYSRFEFYNGKYCFSIHWRYFYFGFDKSCDRTPLQNAWRKLNQCCSLWKVWTNGTTN